MGYNDDLNEKLAGQIPEAPQEDVKQTQQAVPGNQTPEFGSMIGKKIHVGQQAQQMDKESVEDFTSHHGLSRIGESITQNADIRDGWMEVDKALLGDRVKFYRNDWQFRIRPATVEAIRNWSTIDDENAGSVDRVFNEIMKSCFAIQTATGPTPWYNINAWDRFFFILLIQSYTFSKGETTISYTEDCPNCEEPVEFKLEPLALSFDLPDPEVMPMFDEQSMTWIIDTNEYGLEAEEPLRLYLPTLEKDINIKQWAANRYQENPNRNIDPVLLRFLPWFLPKISKDDTIAQRQIKEFRMKFEHWDKDEYKFYDDVITNIMVTPSMRLIKTCPKCGEEVSSPIRFPDGPSALFNVQGKYKKFGKK